MPEALYVGLGLVLVVVVFVDALTTTLSVSHGAGAMTRRITGLAWKGMLRLHRQDSGSALLGTAGPLLLVGTVLLWVALLWAGWTLVLLSGSPGVVQSSTGAAAGPADVIYYAGFTVFTLGVGDFVATSPVTRVATAVASFTGLFLITLAITYLLSVVSAVVTRRAIAVQIGALGSSPGEIVAAGWDGHAFSSAWEQHLVDLTGQLATSAEQHLAYPVLHFFHSRSRDTSAPVAVAHLDEAMLLIEAAVDPAAQPGASTVAPARIVVGRYLETTGSAAGPSTGVPPEPDLSALRRAGVPLVATELIGPRLAEGSERRRRLADLLTGDGWSWR